MLLNKDENHLCKSSISDLLFVERFEEAWVHPSSFVYSLCHKFLVFGSGKDGHSFIFRNEIFL